MYQSLYISEYNERQAHRTKRASHLAQHVSWADRLPPTWKDQVIGPLWVNVFRDPDIGAERWVGYNEDEQACYCHYRFMLAQGDDPLHPGEQRLGYSEDLVAWLMRDGRWLIHRIIFSAAEQPASNSFYALSEHMPR
jgi:hypothetical protein